MQLLGKIDEFELVMQKEDMMWQYSGISVYDNKSKQQIKIQFLYSKESRNKEFRK